jgi:hypothetical protein
MRYQVPQFIEVESKIFGPLTLKQFIYLAGGAGLLFLFYIFLPLWLTVLFGFPVAGLAAALTFYKVNNQPFIKVMENAIKHYLSGRLYLWKKIPQQKIKEEEKAKQPQEVYIPKLTQSKLKDLAWSLDVQSRIK